MRRRLTVGEDGVLRDKAGATVGRLVSMVVEWGDIGGLEEPSTGGREDTKPRDGGVGETPSDVQVVWAHYQATIPGASRQTLDGVKRRVIVQALQVRSVERCCQAIDGLAASPHHNGQNDRRKKYLGIRYALKGNSAKGEGNDERVDKMAEIAPSGGGDVLATIPSAGREMVRTRQRQVEEMLLHPGDSNRAARAQDSERYLRENFGLTAHVADGSVKWRRDVMKAARAEA